LAENYYKKGSNLGYIQEMNRSLVLRLIRRLNICSRAVIAKETGLKQATVTNIVNDLIKFGLVKETGIISGKKGRRSIGITLDDQKFSVIGLRLTRKYYSIGLFGLNGGIKYKDTKAIKIKNGSRTALEKIKKSILDLINKSNNEILVLCMTVPGPFIESEGKIVVMSEFPGWENINLYKELKSYLKIPVHLEHDANAGALAEWYAMSPNELPKNMVYIAAGQGIGSGIIYNGKIFKGAQGIAGEIGHMSIEYDGIECECGRKGCLTKYFSTIALVREAKKGLKYHPESILNKRCDFDNIVYAVKKNDMYARDIFQKILKYLVVGLVNVINIFDPDKIIIGDEFARFDNELLEHLKSEISKVVIPSIYNRITFSISNRKEDPAFIGAGYLAINRVIDEPLKIINPK
jgi:predicted NBD/HSP70 family sugar kinase